MLSQSVTLEYRILGIPLQNHAESIALDEYVLKTCLDVQIGRLGAENERFKNSIFFAPLVQQSQHPRSQPQPGIPL